MGVAISITNQKGGVGKTVTVSTMASALTMQGYKVLLINLDPQRNLDMVAGKGVAIRRGDTESLSVLNVLRGECSLEDAIVHTEIGDLVRASSMLSQWTGRHLISRDEFRDMDKDAVYSLMEQRYNDGWGERDAEVLAKELQSVKDKYDYILMDTNPSLTLLTLNSLYAAEYVLIPAFTEAASRDAITELWDTINGIKYFNPAKYLEIAGILITKYAVRSKNAKRYVGLYHKLAQKMGTILFETKIRNSVSVSEYMTAQVDLLHYDKSGNTAQDYLVFVEEFKARIKEMEAVRYGSENETV